MRGRCILNHRWVDRAPSALAGNRSRGGAPDQRLQPKSEMQNHLVPKRCITHFPPHYDMMDANSLAHQRRVSTRRVAPQWAGQTCSAARAHTLQTHWTQHISAMSSTFLQVSPLIGSPWFCVRRLTAKQARPQVMRMPIPLQRIICLLRFNARPSHAHVVTCAVQTRRYCRPVDRACSPASRLRAACSLTRSFLLWP